DAGTDTAPNSTTRAAGIPSFHPPEPRLTLVFAIPSTIMSSSPFRFRNGKTTTHSPYGPRHVLLAINREHLTRSVAKLRPPPSVASRRVRESSLPRGDDALHSTHEQRVSPWCRRAGARRRQRGSRPAEPRSGRKPRQSAPRRHHQGADRGHHRWRRHDRQLHLLGARRTADSYC